MPRDNKNYALTMTSTAMASTDVLTSEPIKLFYDDLVSVQAAWTGTPVGNWTLEVSNDDGRPTDLSNPVTSISVTNWTSVTGSSAAAGGAAGTQFYDMSQTAAKWARIKYTNASSTGTITSVRVTAKGR